MMRLLLLPLFLFTLSMACMGQTFQYSRGWTNGKRALTPPSLLSHGHFNRASDLGFSDLYDVQDWSSERRLERCLAQLQRSLLSRVYGSVVDFNANRPEPDSSDSGSSRNRANNNNENVLYPTPIQNRHHSSNELLEEISAAVAGSGPTGAGSGEPSVFGKH
ncbi:GL23272 [Drosophila persimilis]|uniref:Pro-corazonin n=2 Tax=pseudoobscura subgroup TaxID=32358 RepID=CORZ_DROPS|nr:pro-corazonin [Drosophila persimilis]Q299B0.1 RecName: Full=Pro-corazonin; Short=Crz; Short=Dp-Crz; Contains: RecName: Full=Corazonin; Contains: RecName: Full=Corazonin precursor-related peptide; Short=CPRP; Flags: Precursor [Drosophila pseudoobscura pseudoobscura]EDW24657.1 GL23272 [Drosophila persimilis]